ncbi:hypothetical protein [Methylopila sp. M107]|uniref:hypothetical protein n=1 Tax=Methylopila sp. M107 TaxID=1101190 RepID=UPI00036950EC|nr:hypothetical protein [Methylopila sp. M107]
MPLSLVEALSEMRIETARMALENVSMPPTELAQLARLFGAMEVEAVRLEAIEIAARAKLVADTAAEALIRTQPVDLDWLESMVRGGKIVMFPTRRTEPVEALS